LIKSGRSITGMLIASFTLLIRTDAVILIALLFAWYFANTRTFRSLLPLFASLIPAASIFLAANYVRYHTLFDRGYSGEGFFNNAAAGLYGIFLSAGKSIFIFSPPLILSCVMWNRFRKREPFRYDAWFFLAVLVSQAVLYAAWWDWPGDDSWGVRFVIPGVMLMCIPIVELAERPLRILPFAVAGAAVQLLAVPVGTLDFLLLLRSHEFHREAQFVSGTNRVDFADIRFNPSYSQINGQWILLRHLLKIPPKTADAKIIKFTGTPLYDALPPEAWAQAAQWDFIWNARRRREAPGSTPAQH
jgi:hypothetical protein